MKPSPYRENRKFFTDITSVGSHRDVKSLTPSLISQIVNNSRLKLKITKTEAATTPRKRCCNHSQRNG